MSISATSPFFSPACSGTVEQDLSQPDMYKTAQAEAYGNLLDRTSSAGQGVYQHNQTDLECLRAERCAVEEPNPVGARWEGPELDAARMAAGFFRPNPNGDGTTEHLAAHGFMDYTDDSCMGVAAERNRQRVSDGTSNTVMFSEG